MSAEKNRFRFFFSEIKTAPSKEKSLEDCLPYNGCGKSPKTRNIFNTSEKQMTIINKKLPLIDYSCRIRYRIVFTCLKIHWKQNIPKLTTMDISEHELFL